MADFLTIGIPAYNEVESIEQVLNNIMRQSLWKKTPPDRREIIVCENGSTDKTYELLEGIAEKVNREHPHQIRIIKEPEKGKTIAWKRIVKAANKNAREIIFSDADVFHSSNAFLFLKNALRREKNLEITGAKAITIPRKEKSWILRGSAKEARRHQLQNPQGFVSGSLYCMRRETAKRMEETMPNDTISEDRHFTNNCAFRIVEEAQSYPYSPETVLDYVRLRRRFNADRKQREEMGVIEERIPEKKFSEKVRSLKGKSLKTNIKRTAKYGLNKFADSKLADFIFKHSDIWPSLKSTKFKRRKPM
ncbi:MAG: glycosyltransferase [Candidatus Diapherotrites archaeon]